MEQWAPHLAERGVQVRFEPFEDAALHDVLYRPGHAAAKAIAVGRAFGRRRSALRHLREFDAVYLLREAALLGPAIIERLIGRSKVPIVFDFDDAVFERYVSPSNGYLSLLKFPGKTATICRLSAHVMAGNAYLADYARRHAALVTVVPTTIDTDRYRPAKNPAGRGPTIGWSGSHSTVQHLRRIDRALQRLASTHPFTLRVIGTPSYSLDGVRVEAMPWRAATEVDDLQAIDVGLMPLPDDRWSRGKCGLKALQYMALGTPAVCSPVGVNATIIDDGRNGLLADDEDDWVRKLQMLLDSAPLREQLGSAGRETVCRRYSAASQVGIVHDIFQAVARREH